MRLTVYAATSVTRFISQQVLTSFLVRVVLDGPGVAAVGVVGRVEGAAAVVDVVALELPGDAVAALAAAREAVPLAAVPLGVGSAHRDAADLRPHRLEALRTHRLRRHQKSVRRSLVVINFLALISVKDLR